MGESVPFPSQKRPLKVAVSAYVRALKRHPDKAALLETIRQLQSSGFSLREIASEVGLHWMHIGQLLSRI